MHHAGHNAVRNGDHNEARSLDQDQDQDQDLKERSSTRGDTGSLGTDQKRTPRAQSRARKSPVQIQDPEAVQIRRIVVVLQDLLRTAKEPYTTYADVKADLAAILAKLRLRYDSAQLAAALDRVELGGQQPIVAPRVARKTPEPKLLPDASPHFSREDATRLLDALKVGTKGMR